MSLPPLLFALFMWFVGTGAVVWLDSRPRATFRTSFRLAGLVALAAMAVAGWSAGDASPSAAYIGFSCAILIWGWHEMGFLMGFVAGPNRLPCPSGTTGWARFRLATGTVIHHEIALAANLLALVALSWGQPNQAAALTFALLFGMRLSAKLNLYLGVANLSDEIFPAHLAYLKSYFGARPINWLYPFSIVGGAGIAVWAWLAAESASGGMAITCTLLAGLAVLGVVEHLFLVLPLRDGAMWRWFSASKPPVVVPAKSE
ncbi:MULTISPECIES: putative photosynthetic complex assembly protein PuhE [unclassified Sphingomonas]|uniref:putative photosynthetic complex assembly protein PuhE n=1 Tax=unclassified Sphingomonas TaxID=196159 RepID=UPI00082DB3C1|nr:MULTISPECIES: putative photosynthetic complex assembly protein PuhE [unclassified Sphingomonas]